MSPDCCSQTIILSQLPDLQSLSRVVRPYPVSISLRTPEALSHPSWKNPSLCSSFACLLPVLQPLLGVYNPTKQEMSQEQRPREQPPRRSSMTRDVKLTLTLPPPSSTPKPTRPPGSRATIQEHG